MRLLVGHRAILALASCAGVRCKLVRCEMNLELVLAKRFRKYGQRSALTMADILIDTKVQKTGLLYKLPFANQLVRPRGSWKKRFFIVKVHIYSSKRFPSS